MNYCPTCGTKIVTLTDGSKANYCTQCGSSIKDESYNSSSSFENESSDRIDRFTLLDKRNIRRKVSIKEGSAIGSSIIIRFISSKVYDVLKKELLSITNKRDELNYIDKIIAIDSIEKLDEYSSYSINQIDYSEMYAVDAFDYVEYINLSDSNGIIYREESIHNIQMNDLLVMKQLGINASDLEQFSYVLVSGFYGSLDFNDAVTDAENYYIFEDSKELQLEFGYGGLTLKNHDIKIPIFASPNPYNTIEEACGLISVEVLADITISELYRGLDTKLVLAERPDFIKSKKNNSEDNAKKPQEIRVQGTGYGYMVCLKFISEKVKNELVRFYDNSPKTVYGSGYTIYDDTDIEMSNDDFKSEQEPDDELDEMDAGEKVWTMMDLAHSKNSVKQYKHTFNLKASKEDFGESLWLFIIDHVESIKLSVDDLQFEDSEISIGDAEDFEPSIYQTLKDKGHIPEELNYVLVTWEVGAIDFEGESQVINSGIDETYDFEEIEFTNESIILNKKRFPKTEIELSATFDGNRLRAQIASILTKEDLKESFTHNVLIYEEQY